MPREQTFKIYEIPSLFQCYSFVSGITDSFPEFSKAGISTANYYFDTDECLFAAHCQKRKMTRRGFYECEQKRGADVEKDL